MQIQAYMQFSVTMHQMLVRLAELKLSMTELALPFMQLQVLHYPIPGNVTQIYMIWGGLSTWPAMRFTSRLLIPV